MKDIGISIALTFASFGCTKNTTLCYCPYAVVLGNKGDALRRLQKYDEAVERYDKTVLSNKNGALDRLRL